MKSPLSKLRRAATICSLIFPSMLLVGCCGCGSSISPEDRTYTSVSRLRVAINSFVAANGRAPSNIEELARYEPVVSTLKDGWNNHLVYEVESSDTGVIKSLGKDNSPGGSGQNADALWSFALKDKSGNWIGTDEVGVIPGFWCRRDKVFQSRWMRRIEGSFKVSVTRSTTIQAVHRCHSVEL
jgi:hypothetical protein